MSTLRPYVAMLAAVVMLGACQAGTPKQLAVFDTADDTSMAALRSTLAKAMGVATVELGPGDPSVSSTVSVLPPRPGPYEMNSPAMPTIFDIVTEQGNCFVVRRETGEAYALDGVACRAL